MKDSSKNRKTENYCPEKILVEASVLGSAITENVLRNLPGIPVEVIETTQELLTASKEWQPTIPVAKRNLVLARHQGAFFKPCPGRQSRGAVPNTCCNYFVINFGANCHMECSYCYLQTYLNFPYMIIYANYEDLLGELGSVFESNPDTSFRVGTGELADSLALDPITAYSVPLVEFFAAQPNAVLELKTKSDQVDRLLGLEHGGRTVVAWSVNPPFVQRSEEHKTATLRQRLHAARRCVESGYRVAFHFDPIVHYDAWEKDYRLLVDELFDTIPCQQIAWISLGALRMSPELKNLIRQRFPRSFLPLGELLPSSDGKLRYVKPVRRLMYERLLAWIRNRTTDRTAVYACMERPEVWARVFHADPPSDEEIGETLYRLAVDAG